jgi:hypothetical protein
VRLLPALTGSGVSIFVVERSAEAVTVVVAVPLSFPVFGSVVADVTVAVLLSTVPAAVGASTFTTRLKTAFPAAKLGIVQEIGPAAPTAGVVHDQPAGEDSETNVVLAGSVSVMLTVDALLGPPLFTVMV